MDATFGRLIVIALYSACLTYFIFTATDAHGAEPIPRLAYQYRANLIREARFVFGLQAPSATFGAQIDAESGYRPTVRSRAGAQGLAQFMPATARGMARLYSDLRPAAPLNPAWAIRALVRYNYQNYRRTGKGTLCQKIRLTLASYNAGPGVHRRKSWPRETKNYVARIIMREPAYIAANFGLGSCN